MQLSQDEKSHNILKESVWSQKLVSYMELLFTFRSFLLTSEFLCLQHFGVLFAYHGSMFAYTTFAWVFWFAVGVFLFFDMSLFTVGNCALSTYTEARHSSVSN